MLTLNEKRVSRMPGRRQTKSDSDKIAKERVIRLYNEYKRSKLKEGIKVTQEVVANKMGVERSLVSGELGRHASIGIAAAKRWARFFGIQPWELHPDIEEPYQIDEKLMESLLCVVISIIKEDGVRGVDDTTVARLVSALYTHFKKRNVTDIDEIRDHVRTALLVSRR